MLQELYDSSLRVLSAVGAFIANTSKDLAGPTVCSIAASGAEKAKDFYLNNKEIVISVSVATTVYLLMRPAKPKKEERDPQSKRESAKKSMIKSFISEVSEIEEEDPTMVSKREWSFEERRVKTEQLFSSEEEQDEEEDNTDKIFFEMYQGYLQGS